MSWRWGGVAEEACRRGAQQALGELTDALRWLSTKEITSVLEIGSADGGTAWALGQLTPAVETSRVTVVDLNVSVLLQQNMRDLAPRSGSIFQRNSHDVRTADEVWRSVGPVDLLFIDGGHSYTDVKLDWDIWSRFMLRGSIVGFHDTTSHWEVRRLVEELGGRRKEVVHIPGEPIFGITFIEGV